MSKGLAYIAGILRGKSKQFRFFGCQQPFHMWPVGVITSGRCLCGEYKNCREPVYKKKRNGVLRLAFNMEKAQKEDLSEGLVNYRKFVLILMLSVVLSSSSTLAANIKIVIPNEDYSRVIDALAGLNGYRAVVDGKPNAKTKDEFVVETLTRQIRELTVGFEMLSEKALAEASLENKKKT